MVVSPSANRLYTQLRSDSTFRDFMNVKLSVIKDGEVYKQLTVALPVVIGRGTEAGLTIKHPLVSRKHCELFAADGSVQVKDLFSLNGTFVGGKRVDTQAVVATGSELKLGVVEMTVEFSEVSDALSTAVHEVQEPASGPAETEALDLGDFEINEDASGPAASEALDLGNFEVSEQDDEGEAVADMPSLMDLANMADEDVEAAASAEQPAAPPEQKKTDDDNDDELQAFLNDLGG